MDNHIRAINRRIDSAFSLVSPSVITDGKNWYPQAHAIAVRLGTSYTLPLERTAAIIAVLSPATHFDQNIKDAETLIQQGDTAIVTTYGANKRKALALLAGNPIDSVVGGNKVTSFFNNILFPDRTVHVTIDRHMIRLLLDYPDDLEYRRVYESKRYDVLANCIKRRAAKYQVLPLELQAILWIYQRNLPF